MRRTYTTPGGTVPRFTLDILDQPHTLIAGTTGSGKSVLLNTIIYTILHFAPCEKQLILIDPKKVDLRKFRKLPHTLVHAKENAEIIRALKWAENCMDKRYRQMEKVNVELYQGSDIYVVIDELSDILTERSIRLLTLPIITRLARFGRAARIHVIGATQCPNRKTLSAEFVGNCPCRVGLRCREAIESRQIVGNNDAMQLPMHGAGIYYDPKFQNNQKITIPMIPQDELNRLINYWTRS